MVSGRRLSTAVVEFGCDARVSIGERADRAEQWWSVAKLVFTVRTIGTTAARDQLGPTHSVAGIACVCTPEFDSCSMVSRAHMHAYAQGAYSMP